MKIDSPTFLTETTFISASVQFSSGSQKFGDTSDDIHQFTGSVSFGGPVTASSNISGSATSTGSFGSLISRTTYIGDGTPIFNEGSNMLVVDSTDSQILSIRRADGNNQWNFGLSVTGDLNFRERTNDAGSGTTHHIFYKSGYVKFGGNITGSGNLEIAGNISGSSTSTGSFGSLYLHGGNRLGVDSTTKRFINAEGNSSGRGFMVKDWDDNKSGSFYQRGSVTTIEAHSGAQIDLRIAGTTFAYVDNDGQMHVSATANAAKPGYTFITDTNTGMYHAGTDALGLTAGGTEQLRIASNTISGSATSTGSFGAVAIGTPNKNTFYGLTIQDDSTAGIALNDTGQGGPYQIAANGSVFYIRYNGENTRSIFLGNTGNVGIGGASTGAKLEVAGNISGSATSTGSFGRVEAKRFSGSYAGQMGSRFVHSQTSAGTTWTINHNLGHKYPVVTVYDSSDQMILPQNGVATDSDTFTLTFNESITGKAVVSIGGIGTNAGNNYIHTQGAGSTNWRVTHSLSQRYPNVTVFDENNQVILPETITATSANHADIVFSTQKTGYANFSIGSGIPNISSGNAGKFLKVRADGEGVEWVPTTANVSGSMSVSGSILPNADNHHDLGSESKRWANLFTGDIELSNEGTKGNEVDGTTGKWTIQEGEDDLYLLNRKNGKKYRFKLQEIT